MTPQFRRLLEKRGIEDIANFLNPSIKNLEPPSSLSGVDKAAEEIFPFIYDARKIVVFGDYDCDGICATAVMVRVLRKLGANCEAFLPERMGEGYGMTSASLDRMLREHPDVALVITVDNGINSIDEVERLKKMGVSVVVTDHHLPGEKLPNCTIVNPSVASTEALTAICGAAVAFMLANRIVDISKSKGKYTGGKFGGEALVLAGLATVTDVMPLKGNNRILVYEALRRFNQFAPEGLRQLVKLARGDFNAPEKEEKNPTVKDFGFLIGPRINAPGRMATGDVALKLVLCDDNKLASSVALEVDAHNSERKKIELEMMNEAMEKVVPNALAQVIDLPNGKPGVAGIVASRILENLGSTAPVCVIAGTHGSARSPEGFNIRDAFEACSEYLERFGGHAAAAGFSVKDGKVDAFRQALCEYTQNNFIREENKELSYDIVLSPNEITKEFYNEILSMEPFGEGNAEPLFKLENVKINEAKVFGANEKHLSFYVCDYRAVWWNHGEIAGKLSNSQLIDIYFSIKSSDYSRKGVELVVKSIPKVMVI